MKRRESILCFSLLAAALASVQPAVAALPDLPVPLKLPTTLRYTLPVIKENSYFGDAVRIVDCPKESQNPLGTCDNWLFGGLAMWDSHISGLIELRFYKPIDNIAHFEVSHPNHLVGDNAIIQAPQGYEARVRDNVILDALDQVSGGDLNLITGEVTGLKFALLFSNTWYGDLTTINPRLKPPDFTFPGIYGSARFWFEQRADGQLDLTVTASTFLPLNNAVKAEPVQIPVPWCSATEDCVGIQAPGTGLHPHIFYTTRKPPADVPCGQACVEVTPNSFLSMTGHTYYTTFGDNFDFNVPELGGLAPGRSHLQGRVQLQFGPRAGNFVPVSVSALPPLGQLARLPDAPAPLSTFKITLIGHDEYLRFPFLTYVTSSPVLLEDSFDLAVAHLNLNTGLFNNDMVYRGIPAQSLFVSIINLNITRIPLDTFRFRGTGYLRKGPHGESIFGYQSLYINSFDTFSFPSPDYSKPNRAFIVGAGSYIRPFLHFQGIDTNTERSTIVKTGSADRLNSSLDEPFSYTYSISCDPAAGTGTFDMTNFSSAASGGSFHMENISSVNCSNSKFSTTPAGDFDTVTFAGYGTWSRDAANGRHLVTFQESKQPGLPLYVTILIDGGLISKTHTKPPFFTTP